ncbi:MAG: GNAT family N-acetyltransferase [Solobacterium sp.]|nr:GNAT family N-acetyltransferase [Solobacterium sp.]
MEIRRACRDDIHGISDLLMQVLNIHAEGRPDLFIPNTVKYTEEELNQMILNDNAPIFAAVEDGKVLGYAMTEMKQRLHSNNMTDIRTLFIDDLCVDGNERGKHIGHELLAYVKEYARAHGVYHITLNVWSFNTPAIRFYEKEGMKPMETVMEYILEEHE